MQLLGWLKKMLDNTSSKWYCPAYFMFVSFLPYGTFTVVTFVIRFF